MLRPRDKKIIQALHLFRCISRDQIAKLFFSNVKNPITAANYVLKRLRRENHIDANVDTQPYIYFPKPSTIKKNSQKTKHYLAIVDFYIDVCKYECPAIFEVEKRYGSGYAQPDIYMVWQGKVYFVEIQLSRYSSDLIEEKLNRYENYLKSEKYFCKKITSNINDSPYIWIVSKTPYAILNSNLKVIQTSNVDKIFSDNEILNYK
ncbi:replication-relaxation family protein [Bacillus thuringiensis]|uniref:replication-relaxation family protein n=1 Tax=Bacillus thuringiensis TaxID=1428 RepID=UPI0022250986|nr:replication-relaxation family protein [Bacillus thuringiensis]UYX52217.1 replication-relaxation family protein [Bacillus thuringiensis]